MNNKPSASARLFIPPRDGAPGRLLGSRCRTCDAISFPRRGICPRCLEREALEETTLSSRGVLYSFAVNRQAPEGFVAPYVSGKVDLPEKVRVFSIITGVDPDEDALRLGQPMELVFGPLPRDPAAGEFWSYMFRPVGEGS
ncbi:MAG: Zn-ribbon domain-containing OB-fold protein [Pseudomonadota bacterium]